MFERQSVETSGKSEVRLSGGFRTNGASSPTVIYGNWIQSVTRNSAGTYTVTMKKDFRFMDIVGKSAILQVGAVLDSKVQLGPYDKVAGTQVVFTITGVAVADIAADVNNIVWIELIARYGIVPDGSPNYDV